MNDVAAVIVHHNRHEDIADVVLSLASAGIDQTRIVVVDNSEKPHLAQELESSIHPATVLFVPNDGYGAAANAGLRHIDSALADAAYVLVATHEVGIEENSLAALRDVLEGNSHLSAVGPTLVDSESKKNDVWSQGGGFTPWGRMPRHVRRDTGPTPSFVVREWLDGAVVLYRRSHLGFDPFDEAFFLYMEEVDLHLRLAYQGTPVAWVPGARASQSSSGTPARLFARNLRYLHAKHRMGRGGLRAMVPIARRAAGFAARGEWNRFAQLARGVLEPLPRPKPCIILVNPLGVALSHYAAEFRSVCATAGVQMVGVSFAEPSAAGDGRLRWVWRYLRSLQMARSLSRGSHSRIVVAWPVLGFLDPLLIVLFARRADIVMHDPKPLVHAVGYGAFGRGVARRLMSRVKYLVHSGAAQREMLGLGFPSRAVVEMNHPVLPPTEASRAHGNPVVRVLGQYKPDRDTDLMRVVAEGNPGDWRYEVCGRGWPDVPGWEIESRFLSETEFEEKLTSATVVLVPYHRFYQSGVALRAMESGTPVVAPKDSVLGPLVSPEHWITDSPDSAARAVFHAVTQKNEGWTQAFVGFRERAVRQISDYLDGGHDERG